MEAGYSGTSFPRDPDTSISGDPGTSLLSRDSRVTGKQGEPKAVAGGRKSGRTKQHSTAEYIFSLRSCNYHCYDIVNDLAHK